MGASLPIVISFATPGYRPYLDRLVRSLDLFGLEHHVVERSDLGSWERNCNQKPCFILEQLSERGTPVLWLDADAEVVQVPELFADADFDFAVCHRATLGFGSGTLYFSPRALPLVVAWQDLATLWPLEWDQRLLERAWRTADEAGTAPNTRFLPETYLQKIDDPVGAVILQHQASRNRLRDSTRSLGGGRQGGAHATEQNGA